MIPVTVPGAPVMTSSGNGNSNSGSDTSSANQPGSSGDGQTSMLGANGPQFASKTIWKCDGQERIDVENPNPGQRPGQIRYQDDGGTKYLYDPVTNSFPGAPNSINKMLSIPSFNAAIQKGLSKYLGGN